MKKLESNLLESEKMVLKKAKALIDSGKYDDNILLEQYRIITEHFGKLLQEVDKIISFNEGQQEYFYRIQDDLQKEIKNRIKAEEKLQHLATTDTLTGVYNRGSGLSLLEDQVSASKQHGYVFSICYIDINDLKYVNDNFGHFEGDTLLVAVCNYIKGVIREYDILCRLGGDEFLLVIPQCTKENAEAIIKRIIAKINADNNEQGKPYHISFCYGIIQVDANNNEKPINTLIEMADIKMYEHKTMFRLSRRSL
ncbi:MAG TPA: GGDEF domain-containing protein [Syntrophomonadaceae bacterium]|nr:GGDEF domain-containing protein [Syntrophomonadaceae bacterium]